MEADSFIPDRALEYCASDRMFEAAYESLAPKYRARFKQNIALLHAVYGVDDIVVQSAESTLRQGHTILSKSSCPSWTAIIVDSPLYSPVCLQAAVLPPVFLSGTNVFVFRVGDFPQDHWTLPAMELAGVENVFTVKPDMFESLFCEFAEPASGAVIVLRSPESTKETNTVDEGISACLNSNDFKVFEIPYVFEIGVWNDQQLFDVELLADLHPETRIDVWGGETESESERLNRRKGSFEDFIQYDYSAVFVPEPAVEEALASFPLVFGPGYEGCWFWPELDIHLFRQKRRAFKSVIRPEQDES